MLFRSVETLTNEIEARADELIEKITAMGGMLKAIETGFVQRQIQASAFRQQRAIDSGEQRVVGVNVYRAEKAEGVPVFQIDPAIEREQVARVQAWRARRDAQHAAEALGALERAAVGSDNLMPLILSAVEASATVGEISGVLRKVFGEYKESAIL